MMDIEDVSRMARRKTPAARCRFARFRGGESEADPHYRTPARYVRINACGTDRMVRDLKAVVRPASKASGAEGRQRRSGACGGARTLPHRVEREMLAARRGCWSPSKPYRSVHAYAIAKSCTASWA